MGDQNQQSSTPPPSTAMPSAITPTNLSQNNTPGQELLRPPSHSTPLRRSPRLSSPIPETPNVSRQEHLITVVGEVLQESRPVTPENEQVANDEPSSVLASRIMRAHDNPSPPPQGIDRDSSPGKSFPIFPSLDVFESPIQPLRNLFESPSQVPLSPSSPPILTHPPSPIQTTPSAKDISQPDLISFDSFSNTPAGPSIPACSTSLLDSSPAGSLFSEGERDTIVPSSLRNVESANDNLEQEALSNSSEEQDVVNALIPTDENSIASTSTAVQKLVDDCQTPIRHSGRPRRSLLTTVLSPVKEKLSAIRSPDHNEASAKPEDKGKGKKTLFPEEGDFLEKSVEITVATTPRTRPDRRRDGSPTRRKAGNVLSTSRRQLASLSPGTTNLLGQLPSVLRPSPGDANTTPSTPQPLSLPPSATLPASSNGPIRFPSPKRQAQPLSPERPQFRLPLDDPNRTPARRIPLEQAVAQGQLSPQRAAIFSNPRTNNSGSLFNIPPSDSPPRRVPLTAPESPMRASKWGGVRFGGKSPERSRSVEPQAVTPPTAIFLKGKQRSGSAEPTGHPGWSTSTKLEPPRKLPFPISSSRPHLPSSISEEAAAADPSPSLPTTSTTDGETVNKPTSPTPLVIPQLQTSKSSLRQPSVITSKIPRKKPYARPGVASASRIMESQTVKSSRTIGLQRADPSAPASKGSTLGLGLSMPTTNLKRKRGPDPLPSPSRPVTTVVRQVLPRIKPSSPARRSSQRTLKLQLVAERDGRLATSKSPPTEPTPASPPSPQNIESVPQLLSTPAENTPSLENSALADAPTSPRVESSSESRTLVDTSPMAPPAPEPPLPGVRRTTRVRKSIHPGTDIFSRPSDAPPPRPRPRKPKAEDPMFAGMTSIALRHLTSSNTVKNQVYLAATLATEIIRKEGARPESPIMKARTVSQKEADEKGRLRRERAERRARRLNEEKEDEEENLSVAEEEEDDDDDDGWDQLDSSPVRVGRHRRGPGEEEDYETPIRRPPEKAQFAGEAYAREKKHVKWDRGLSTAIFVDEIKLQNINPPKENDVKKSCLAPTAKAIPLDTLGNLPNASSPLRDLIPENIVVQKFVYDSDLPQETEPAVVRNTRSRSKRSKS